MIRNIDYIKKRLHQGALAKEIAAEIGCHPTSVGAVLARHTGMNIREYRQARSIHDSIEPTSLFDLVPRRKDPRSPNCQQVEYCAHTRCHMHWKCPAHAAYLRQYRRLAA